MKIKGKTFINNTILAKLFDIGLRFVVPVILLGLLYIGLK